MSRAVNWTLCLAACLLGFALARQVPARDESSTAADRTREDFELMRLFAEACEQIDLRYVREVDRRKLLDHAIRGMLSGLDPYSSWIARDELARFEQSLDQEFTGIGIQVHLVNGRVEILNTLADSPAARAGVRSGDILMEVDGHAVTNLSPTEIGKLISGPVGRPVSLRIQRAKTEAEETLEIVREKVTVPTVSGVTRDSNSKWEWWLDAAKKIGYIRLSHFSRNTAAELRQALQELTEQQARGLILDLRSNPGGRVESAVEIADMFLDSGRIVSMRGRTVSEKVWEANAGIGISSSLPLAVLINRQSASASEILAAALQDQRRAVLVGERSFGKGSVQTVIRMDGGRAAMKLTTAGYLRPSGVNIHKFPDSRPEDDWGVRPDPELLVELTNEQWTEWLQHRESRSGTGTTGTSPPNDTADLQLQRALVWAVSQASGQAP